MFNREKIDGKLHEVAAVRYFDALQQNTVNATWRLTNRLQITARSCKHDVKVRPFTNKFMINV